MSQVERKSGKLLLLINLCQDITRLNCFSTCNYDMQGVKNEGENGNMVWSTMRRLKEEFITRVVGQNVDVVTNQ